MKSVLAICLLAALLSGCSVNVIVSPNSTFAVDSLNETPPAYEYACQRDELSEVCVETSFDK